MPTIDELYMHLPLLPRKKVPMPVVTAWGTPAPLPAPTSPEKCAAEPEVAKDTPARTTEEQLVSPLAPLMMTRITCEFVIKVCCKHFGISKVELLSDRRHRSVVFPRQIAMWLMKQTTGRSLPEIGRRLGNRDHTTVLHALRKIEALRKEDLRLKEETDALKAFILSHLHPEVGTEESAP